jgi:hypothetical protein
MMIINDDSRVINKLEASPTDNARVVIYNHHMFIVQATVISGINIFIVIILMYTCITSKWKNKKVSQSHNLTNSVATKKDCQVACIINL